MLSLARRCPLPSCSHWQKVLSRSHVGYMPFEGPLINPNSPNQVLKRELKRINLQPVQKIVFRFDPIHPQVKSIRHAITYLNKDKIRGTNAKCVFKNELLSDRSEASITLSLQGGGSLVFKTAHLDIIDIISLMNKHVLPLVKQESNMAFMTKTSKISKRK